MADSGRPIPEHVPAVADLSESAHRGGLSPDRALVLEALEDARSRTYDLVAPLSDDDYRATHHPVLGPIAWDVAHIGQQEDQWLVQALGERAETRAGYNTTYDAYRNPRATRAALPLLSFADVQRYHDEVRAGVVDVLGRTAAAQEGPLWRNLFVHWMIVLHEHQHNETILQHLYAVPPGRYRPRARLPPPRSQARAQVAALEGWAFHPGGSFPMGAAAHTVRTFDNEWPRHSVEVAPFWLQRTPVTNGQFLEFVESGGYEDASWWDADGWELVQSLEERWPMHWRHDESGWALRVLDDVLALPRDRPVMNVSWHEASAFARWAGARLPTEAEWEYAATWAPARHKDANGLQEGARDAGGVRQARPEVNSRAARKRLFPWGDAPPTRERANLDQLRFGTDPVGSHPSGVSPFGVHQLVGDVWEWTETPFDGYDGFHPFPYPDYSERFFDGSQRVLRGGSWASRPGLAFGTFRNWDLPIRRQLFAGFRLVHDAPHGASKKPDTRFQAAL